MARTREKRVKVRGPRKVTLLKVLILLIPVALIYLGYLFVPPYWRAYDARSFINEQRSQTFTRRSDREPWHELESDVRRRFREGVLRILDIPPEDLEVSTERKEGEILVNVRWVEQVRFFPTKKTMNLEFSQDVRVNAR